MNATDSLFARRFHPWLFASLTLSLLLLASPLRSEEKAIAQPTEQKPKQQPLTIQAQGGDAWKASKEDVEKVLHSTAAELWKHFPHRKLDPILVAPQGGPIVLFKRGPNREYYVRLNTGESYWSQYAYQFAHELTHILCAYREGDTTNQWFEESLCELASLYVLRQMSQTWKTNPPYEHWKSYAPKLADYAQTRIKESPLPKDQTLAQWYEANAASLKENATQREKNNIVAVALLPMFEANPEHWEAIAFLNAGKDVKGQPFADHLNTWHEQVEQKHKDFVKKIAEEFGMKW